MITYIGTEFQQSIEESCNLPRYILASVPLYVVRAERLYDFATASSKETLAAVDKENRGVVFTRETYVQSCTILANEARNTRWLFTRYIIAQHLNVELASSESQGPSNPDTIPIALLQRRWIALHILRGFLCFLVSPTILAFAGKSLLCCLRSLCCVFRLVLSLLLVFLIFMLLLSLHVLPFHKL